VGRYLQQSDIFPVFCGIKDGAKKKKKKKENKDDAEKEKKKEDPHATYALICIHVRAAQAFWALAVFKWFFVVFTFYIKIYIFFFYFRVHFSAFIVISFRHHLARCLLVFHIIEILEQSIV